MVLETRIKPVVKDYGILYEAELKFDASPQRRAKLVEVYNRELVERRLSLWAAPWRSSSICLAAVSGYIRTDEATKGYYTNRLRMLAAAGVGAAGVVIYQMVGLSVDVLDRHNTPGMRFTIGGHSEGGSIPRLNPSRGGSN